MSNDAAPAAPASPFVADPANPTDAELLAAIERGRAAGTIVDFEDIDWAAFLGDDDEPVQSVPGDDDPAYLAYLAEAAAEEDGAAASGESDTRHREG